MFKKKTVETTFHVRYAETDQMGVVHHATYIVWFEEGRSAWMRAMGTDYSLFEQEGFNLAVSEVHARYKKPALYGRKITVKTWNERVRSRSAKICYEVVDTQTDEILVSGYTKHICLDKQGKVSAIPEKWRRLLSGQFQTT